MITVLVDNRFISAVEGTKLLAVCLENGIYIPHLCYLESDNRPTASCRLCFVEVEGTVSPVPACTVTALPGLKVQTATETVRRLQRSALRLLLSVHDADCTNCHANHRCELQNIARFLGISLKPKPLSAIDRPKEVDTSHPFIDHFPHRCVLCGKCIRVCRSVHDQPAFSFTGRGIDTVLRHYSASEESEELCTDCRSCFDVCPVGALKFREPE